MNITDELVTDGTQIENDTVVQSIIELTSDMCSYERSFLVSNIWTQIDTEDQVKMLYMLYCDMGVEEQSKVFALLGQSLNHSILEASKDGYKFAKDIDLENPKEASKVEMCENCEPRLKSFIDSVTENIKYENANINYKSNVY